MGDSLGTVPAPDLDFEWLYRQAAAARVRVADRLRQAAERDTWTAEDPEALELDPDEDGGDLLRYYATTPRSTPAERTRNALAARRMADADRDREHSAALLRAAGLPC